ncbi:23S rRNA pseudouridine2457 synthase [Mariniflexile fucanivorans]|uniref:Pseudouridine synthase n=1 Tax=Mariniflexile fucanivorans TaxID=264023 RepID=A0A4R1RKN9_9FLAO|nr:pseudouridine synthase [Mariniflexile fucanivorans]TCL66754.1 23S rRNA pseudouridine2457 synthase [Mariniflexile fucanivorans]
MEASKNLHRHFIIYKPYGVLSQFGSNDSKQQSKKFLGILQDFPEGIMPIGRLDEKSEGLLLLTTDGKMSDFVNSQKVEKEYYTLVNGAITEFEIEQLKAGVEIGFDGRKYQTKPCKVFKLNEDPKLPERSKKIRDARHGPTSWISITLNEGKFRQVRKMTSAVGFPTLRLVRVRVGNIHLNEMQVGEVVAVDHFFSFC